MNENNQPTDNIELQQAIELGQALLRLENSPDFRMVIKDAYIMNALIVRSQEMLDMQPPVRQAAMEQIMSVNNLRQHLTNVRDMAESAVDAMNEEA